MPQYDFRSPRLYAAGGLAAGGTVPLDRAQANYLVNVLRLPAGAAVLVFNGRQGEWRARLAAAGRRNSVLVVEEQLRPQPDPPDLHLLFAPLKHARFDYVVQKAVEMGASRLQPVMTRHVQVSRVNLDRMRANAIEAAEQCGVLTIPECASPLPFDAAVGALDPDRVLVFCDEDAEVTDPIAALAATRAVKGKAPLAVCIGPEGGFEESERAALMRRGKTVRLALGPRILRADTAAVAALALVQAVLGDWCP